MRKYIPSLLATALTFGIGAVVLGLPSAPPAAGSPAPGSCVRVINDVEWLLDPCIPEGAPLPPDLIEAIDDLAACPPESPPPSTPMSAPVSNPATRTATAAARAGTQATMTATAPVTETPSAPVTETPSASPSDDPPECPDLGDPVPWPDYPPPGVSPSPTPPDPTPSQEPIPAVCEADSPTPGLAADDPKDESADLIKCRKKNELPDPNKPITLVGAGNSLVSAHHQTGFGIGTCEHTASDDRKLTGNDAWFSFVGKYFNTNKQILDYYNFARTGFNTKDIVAAAAADKDGCETPWNRNDAPIKLSEKVIKAAKAAGRAAYFVADGGVNNTNWVKLLGQLAKCFGLDFAVNNLLWVTGVFLVRVGFEYKVLNGLKKDIIKKGGSCITTVKAFGFTWATRIEVPAYDGPGSAAPSALARRIKGDVASAIKTVLDAGADKVVWLLYYDLNQAKVDIANLALAAAKSQFPDWLNRRLPNSVATFNVPIIDSDFAADVTKMTTDLDNEIIAGVPNNAKVKTMTAPAFVPADIQNTAIGGCPHPSDSGHTKLADQLKKTFDAI